MNFNFTLIAIFWGCLASTAFAQTPTLSPNAIDFATAGYADGPINDQADWWESNPGAFVMNSGVLLPTDSPFAQVLYQLPFDKGNDAYTVAIKFQFTREPGSTSGNRIAFSTIFGAANDSSTAERFNHRLQRRRDGANYRLQTNKSEGPNQPNRITGDIPEEPFGFGANDSISDELWFEATYTKVSVDSGWTVYTRIYNLTADSVIKDLSPADTFLSSAAFYNDTTYYGGFALGQSWTESNISNVRIMAFDYYATSIVPTPPLDTIAPTLTLNSTSPVTQGTPISATSDEDGTIYLVPDGTAQDLTTIIGAQVSMVAATANMDAFVPTTNVTPGMYILYATDTSDNVSMATSVVEVIVPTATDTVPPTLTLNSPTSLLKGENISVTSNEDGTVFLVPSGTAQDLGSIMNAQVAMGSATANVALDISTMNVDPGMYILYATDSVDNVSEASAIIELTVTSISGQFAAETAIYPNPATGMLNIESQSVLKRIELYTLQGQRLFIQEVRGKQATINLEPLNEGLYMIKVFDNDSRSFTSRISKQ